MPKYRVYMTMPVFVTVDVTAEDEESAIEKACGNAHLSSYVGNGGTGKLVGTDSQNVHIEPGEEVLEGEHDFDIEVEEIE